jgi:hypothetical protein
MRNGVVDVKKVKRIELGHLSHACSESEIVRRVLEERVVGDGDFVEVDIGLAASEAERLRVGDEMNIVATSREFDAQLGSDDATAAVGGIAGDTDLLGSLSCPDLGWPICP